jgi:O-antigen/teichoic acid export membrane protein
VRIDSLIIFSLGLYGYLLSFVNINASLLTGINQTSKLVKVSFLEAVLNLIFSISLIQLLGVGGVSLGTSLACFCSSFLLLWREVRLKTENKVDFHLELQLKHLLIVVIPSILALYGIRGWYLSDIVEKSTGLIVLIYYVLVSWKIMRFNELNFIKKLFPKNF